MNFSLCFHRLRLNYIFTYLIVISISHEILVPSFGMKLEIRPKRYSYIDKMQIHHCKYIENFVLITDCKFWTCWESQMRDFTRKQFLYIYNTYRNIVFKALCPGCKRNVPAMIQLTWHWWLEKESQKAIRNCPNINHEYNLTLNVEDENGKESRSLSCEMVSTSFPVQGGTQNELLYMLPTLLYKNYLIDMDEEGYRRNLASYIGCSYVSRIPKPNDSSIAMGHLLCYYCSKEKSLRSMGAPSGCPDYTKKSTDENFSDLCKVVDSTLVMPCETSYIPCNIWDKSYSWMLTETHSRIREFDNGTSVIDSSILNVSVSTPPSPWNRASMNLIPINITLIPKVLLKDEYDTKFCIIMLLVCILILSLMIATILLIYQAHIINTSS